MKLLPFVLALSVLAPLTSQTAQEKQKPPADPSFEGCLARGSAEGVFLLQNGREVTGTVVGAGLRFRLVPDNKSIDLLPHLNHVVRVTGPVTGTVPVTEKAPERDLPQLRVKALTMVSNECVSAS